MKSSLPRPLVEAAKAIIIPLLKIKWKRNDIVKSWIAERKINEEEIDWLILNWQRHGKPIPPPPKIKQEIIANYCKEFKCKILVETGTYKGDMIFAQLNNFEQLYSIELSNEYYNNAKIRFKDHPKVSLILGDSGIELPKLVQKLNDKTLFWLDGHYCGGVTAQSEVECPIYAELECIFKSNLNHVILIDDARMFNGTRDYPTLDELQIFVSKLNSDLYLDVKQDIIFIRKK